jgi:pyrroloquinoline quinone biosynthesis protein D
LYASAGCQICQCRRSIAVGKTLSRHGDSINPELQSTSRDASRKWSAVPLLRLARRVYRTSSPTQWEHAVIQPQARLSLAEGVSVQSLGDDEGAVVLMIESGQLFTCNDTTAAVLRAAEGGITFDQLIVQLLTIFEVAEAELREDISALARQLVAEGLVRVA